MSVEALQNAMLEQEQVDCKVMHDFADGMYARTLHIQEGVCVVGARHKTNHFMMITRGEGIIINNDEEEAIPYHAPCFFNTKAGTKRAITAFTDTVMTTFHATEETDIEKIGEQILEPEPQNVLPQWKKQQLESLQ